MAEELRAELVRMMEADQAIRHRAEVLQANPRRPLPADFVREWGALDERHTTRLFEIIRRYGWPGRSVVGEDGALAAFLILQHADAKSQRDLLPMFRQAAYEGEADPVHLAYLTDRVRVGLGEKQLYGTQIRHNERGEPVPFDLEDPDGVDARRAALGLEPLQEYLARFRRNASSPP
ncbi:MAG: hypothetical protein HY763_00940 [Planctomycetes bacterium]|nr:hypothetical protein [Planctomycetota bacterium]